MTDAEWQDCTPHDINRMVNYIRDRMSQRKSTLFVCGCCRRIWGLLQDARFRVAIETAEQNAEQKTPEPIPYQVSSDVWAAYSSAYRDSAKSWDEFALLAHSSAAAAVLCLGGTGQGAVAHHVSVATKYAARSNRLAGRPAAKRERAACLRLLRCVFSNPFRPVAVDPAWLTSTVLALAEGIYQDRAFDRLLVLADALMDAGCDNEDVLSHCRSDGVHDRGCWVVDLLTGRK
jgi:hypothetical protein